MYPVNATLSDTSSPELLTKRHIPLTKVVLTRTSISPFLLRCSLITSLFGSILLPVFGVTFVRVSVGGAVATSESLYAD